MNAGKAPTTGAIPTLRYFVENEFFIVCPLIHVSLFVSFCNERNISTSEQELERFDELGILHPIARIERPRIEMKVEKTDDASAVRFVGRLRPDEKWEGETEEFYSSFPTLTAESLDWLDHGLLWDPSDRPFQPWSSFYDSRRRERTITSLYSIFQSYALLEVQQAGGRRFTLQAEDYLSYSEDSFQRLGASLSQWAQGAIDRSRVAARRADALARLCQVLSNRYYPQTLTDRRALIRIPRPIRYDEWDWHEYAAAWDARSVLHDLNLTEAQVLKLRKRMEDSGDDVDPLRNWYSLVSFVSVDEKEKLRDRALLGQLLWSMESMLRLFYTDVSGRELHPPHERPEFTDQYYGPNVTRNELRYLEFLTNRYHINPRPRLILIVEGHTELTHFPRIAAEVIGIPFQRAGIDIETLKGVSNFTGKKYDVALGGRFVQYVDDHHHRDTLVFIVLDRHPRVVRSCAALSRAHSAFEVPRHVTREDYIRIWDSSIEFDNFSPEEIASAMTEVAGMCGKGHVFDPVEVEAVWPSPGTAQKSDPIVTLFERRVGRKDKTPIIDALFGKITDDPSEELDENGFWRRPVVQLLQRVIDLALENDFPMGEDEWLARQQSGLFGEPIL